MHDLRGSAEEAIAVEEVWIERVEEASSSSSSSAPADGASGVVPLAIHLRLAGHLDTRRRLPAGAFRVTRDDVELPAAARWDPVDRRVSLRFRARLEGVFEVTPDPERLATRTGVAVEAEPVQVPAASAIAAPAPRAAVSWDEDLRAPLAAACGGCHGAPGQAAPPLEPERLRWAPSAHEAGRFLVEPFEPSRSVALLVLLAHVPMSEGRRKPPPWSSAGALEPEVVRAFADWIAAGAPTGDAAIVPP